MPKVLRQLKVGLLGLICFGLVLVSHSQPIAAQAGANLAIISEILDGNQVFIQNRQAKVNDQASRGQKVLTRDARAAILFNNGAIGRLGKNSVLTVGDRCAQIRRGQILVSGPASSCSSSVVAGVRGTTYLLEVDDHDQTIVKVLEGEVTVTSEQIIIPEEPETSLMDITDPTSPIKPIDYGVNLQLPTQRIKQFPFGLPKPKEPKPASLPQNQPSGSPSQPTSQPTSTGGDTVTVVKSGEKVAYNPSQGVFSAVEKMTQQEFESILTGALFSGFSVQIPGLQDVQRSFQNLFPGVPFPINVPSLNVPGLGFPSLPFGF